MPVCDATITMAWGALIIDGLAEEGVSHVCLAPGSRCTPLTVAVARHLTVTSTCHYDERALGFFALGVAKATNHPVAIITTSGSAVANLLPAVVEAYQSMVPLLVITADRPPESHQTGTNQTIQQVGIFSHYVVKTCALGCPTPAIQPKQVQKWMTDLITVCRDQSRPVHMNCMFREPLYPYD